MKFFSDGTGAQKRTSVWCPINAIFFMLALYEIHMPFFVPGDFAKIFSFAG
jgi:hypothetical protein